jgi:hypothetical protein
VDEALELLTGMPAGELAPDGTYPEGTIHYLVSKRLDEMSDALRGAPGVVSPAVVAGGPPPQAPPKPPAIPQ